MKRIRIFISSPFVLVIKQPLTFFSLLLNKELRQILYEYKKGVDRRIYQSGALDCL